MLSNKRVMLVAALALIASTLAFHRMNSILGLIVIAPGYLVQAWLFERHWALGGVGYEATLIGVSALLWTLVLVSAARVATRLVSSRFRGHHT